MKKKIEVLVFTLSITGASIIVTDSCKKEDTLSVPVLTTSAVTSITQTTATTGGSITSDGGAAVTARGVCWNTTANPTKDGSKTSDASGTGSFTSSLTGLTAGTTYHVRAYATNTVGTAYGDDVTFNTGAILVPTLTTTTVTSITQTTASSGGNISSDGGGTVTARGICWNTSSGPTVALTTKTSDGTGTGAFTSAITGLTLNTVYYVRAYATNSAGTAYGNEISFTSSPATIPILTTSAISSITQTTATSGGNITSDGGASVSARGVCWSTTTGPTVALSTKTMEATVGTGSFTSAITGLTLNTVYYVRAYATNSVGTAYGNEISFTSSPVTTALYTKALIDCSSASFDKAALSTEVSAYVNTFQERKKFSISFWYNTPTDALNKIYPTTFTTAMLLSTDHSENATGEAQMWIEINKAKMEYVRSKQTSDKVTLTSSTAWKNLHHMVVLYDGNNMKMYLDNVLINSTPSTISMLFNKMYIGGGYQNSNYDYNGIISKFKIYNTELSPDEIDYLFKN